MAEEVKGLLIPWKGVGLEGGLWGRSMAPLLPQTSKTICLNLTLKLLSVILRELTFDNFETILLEFKTVYHMTGNLGRVRRNSILMCTGNGQVG